MNKLGRVVFLNEEDKGKGEIFIDKSKLNIEYGYSESNLPTLLVGYEETKKYYDINFFDRKINDKLFWTFSLKENINLFRDDLDSFSDDFINIFLKEIKYINFDFILNKVTDLNEVLTCNYIEDFSSFYKEGDFLYLYNNKNNIIIGLDLEVLRILNFDTPDVLNFFTNITEKKFYNDEDKNEQITSLSIVYDKEFELKNIAVLLYFLE